MLAFDAYAQLGQVRSVVCMSIKQRWHPPTIWILLWRVKTMMPSVLV
jgi:hypothetical protein